MEWSFLLPNVTGFLCFRFRSPEDAIELCVFLQVPMIGVHSSARVLVVGKVGCRSWDARQRRVKSLGRVAVPRERAFCEKMSNTS